MSTSSFVDQLYRSFLYRDPDDTGKADWIARIDNGQMSAGEVTFSFLQSQEFSQRVSSIAELYFLFFDRIPDQDGMVHWQSRLDGGVSLPDIAGLFMASQEYHDKYGGAASESEFLDLIYLNVLGRIADDSGKQYWLQKLSEGQTRADVITALSQSTEFLGTARPKVIASSVYFALLERLPTDDELNAAVNGDYQEGLIDQLYASSEYSGVIPPALFAMSVSGTELNEQTDQLQITITRDGFVADTAVVAYEAQSGSALSGADFTANSGNLTFAPGETTKTITIDIINDSSVELEETFSVAFTAPATAVFPDSTVQATILRNDQIAARNLTDLNASQYAVIQGNSANEHVGYQVSDAGDVNGDGFDDLIISQSGNDDGVASNWLIFGRAGGWDQSPDLDSLNGNDGVLLLNGGSRVHTAGDVNSDGFDDLIIANPLASPDGKQQAGESYLVFGRDGAWDATIDLSALDGSNGVTIKGATSGDNSGYSISGVGDVNGDTIGDLIIGAPSALNNGSGGDPGQAYVVFGSDDVWDATINLASLGNAGGLVINGNQFNQLGTSVSNVGDVNGDQINDFLISEAATAVNGQNPANSYLIFGRDGGWDNGLNLSTLTADEGVNIVLPDQASRTTVDTAGDVNGDGFADIMIGVSEANGQAGQTALIFGKRDGWDDTIIMADLNGTDGVVFQGANQSDFSGESISGIGDTNNDGFDDLFIGHNTSGYLIYGRAQGWGASYELYSYSENDAYLLNIKTGDDLADMSVSNAGDVNNDGFADFIIGDNGADVSGQADAGKSYLIFGTDQLFV